MRSFFLYFLLSFSLEYLIPKVNCQVRMVLIFGSVSGPKNLTTYNTLENCKNECYKDEACILAYFKLGECFFCSYDSGGQSIIVKEDLESRDSYVAIKTDISNIPNNTCPASYNDLKFSFTPNVNDTYSWKNTSAGWKFASCKTGWKRFERVDGSVVCMNAYLYSNKTAIQTLKEVCIEQNAVPTGFDSIEELMWARSKTPPSSSLLIGGERDCPTTPCKTFKWTDGYTKSKTFLNSTYLYSNAKMNSDLLSYKCLVTWHLQSELLANFNCDFSVIGCICGYKLQ